MQAQITAAQPGGTPMDGALATPYKPRGYARVETVAEQEASHAPSHFPRRSAPLWLT